MLSAAVMTTTMSSLKTTSECSRGEWCGCGRWERGVIDHLPERCPASHEWDCDVNEVRKGFSPRSDALRVVTYVHHIVRLLVHICTVLKVVYTRVT